MLVFTLNCLRATLLLLSYGYRTLNSEVAFRSKYFCMGEICFLFLLLFQVFFFLIRKELDVHDYIFIDSGLICCMYFSFY